MGTGGATYAGAGVDIGAGDAAVELMKVVARADRCSGIGGFGGQFPLDTARFAHPVLVASTDGVGTKLVVARATGRYDTVGIDLVAMCVDDLVCVGAEPLFMLDYIATGKVDPARMVERGGRCGRGLPAGRVRADRAARRRSTPGSWRPDDLDIAGFAVGAVDGAPSSGPSGSGAGDVIIGLPSPGLRSNGYTLARHVLLERAGRSLGDPAWEGAPTTVADELLRPSVIYTPAVLRGPAAARRRPARLRAHHRRGDRRQPAPGAARGTAGRAGAVVMGRAAAIFGEIQRLGRSRRPRWTGSSTSGVGMALVVQAAVGGRRRLGGRRPPAGRRRATVIGTVVQGAGRGW